MEETNILICARHTLQDAKGCWRRPFIAGSPRSSGSARGFHAFLADKQLVARQPSLQEQWLNDACVQDAKEMLKKAEYSRETKMAEAKVVSNAARTKRSELTDLERMVAR